MTLAKLISITNVAVWGWAVQQAVARSQWKPLIDLCIVTIAVASLKELIRQRRPVGAAACDAFAVGGPSKSFGMPSGHVATAVVAWLHINRTYGQPLSDWTVIGLAAVLMGWSRVRLRCHTPLQSGLGALVGAAVFYYGLPG